MSGSGIEKTDPALAGAPDRELDRELDKATQALLAEIAALGAPPLHTLDVVVARDADRLLPSRYGPGPEMAAVKELELTGADGGSFAIRVLSPARPRAILVYLHGGGWVVGNIDQFDNLGRQLADRARVAVVMVDYRKAPEHPYPVAIEDCWTALQWAADHLDELAALDAPLLVAGDSAGGNLAAVMALRSRERSAPELAQQVLIYPVTDHDFSSPSYRDPANQLLLTTETMQWFWDHYVDESRRDEPEASPLRAADLTGSPPAAIVLAGRDVLSSEGRRYADRLASAGVDVHVREFGNQIHGFFSQVNVLPGSAAGIDWVVGEIDRRLTELGR